MMGVKVIWVLVIAYLHNSYVNSLTCQKCNRARTLEQCTEITHCSSNQECFVDEVVDSNGIFFNAGCRTVEICNERFNFPGVGKRDTLRSISSPDKRQLSELVACSRCCKHDVNLTDITSRPCNTKLCGLPSNVGSNHLTCYECDHVNNFEEDCNAVTTCPVDKVCGTTTQSTTSGRSHTYTFGCFDKRMCIAFTKKLLLLHDTLAPKMNLTISLLGKRSEVRLCNVCCGGSYCNTGDCVLLEKKLHELAKYHHLNLDTLEYIK